VNAQEGDWGASQKGEEIGRFQEEWRVLEAEVEMEVEEVKIEVEEVKEAEVSG